MDVRLVDTHCHLGHIERDLEEVLGEASDAGVVRVIDVGMGTAESAATVDRAERSDGRVFAAIGVHPNDVAEFTAAPEATIEQLRGLAASETVVAIGETGLDHYRDRSPPDLQEAAFVAQIALARQLDKTLVIHCRDAHARLIEVLQGAGPPERVVMHCFSGDARFAALCASHGWFCSFAGNITYPKNEDLREAARAVPAELLLVETDAPFLAPQPYRGKSNAPALVAHTVRALAEARGEAADTLGAQLWENVGAAFALRV
jgi:TatD DNase family protein